MLRNVRVPPKQVGAVIVQQGFQDQHKPCSSPRFKTNVVNLWDGLTRNLFARVCENTGVNILK